MISFPFSLSVLKTVCRIASDDKTRIALNGVNAVLGPGSDVILQATDAFRLIVFKTDWSHNSRAPHSFTIPRDALDALDETYCMTNGTAIVDGERITLAFGSLSVSFKPIEADFPNLKIAIPNPLPEHFQPRHVTVNHEFLAEIMEVVTSLAPATGGGVSITAEPGEYTPLVFKAGHALAVLMPMG